ncbi:MAG: M56 family metallopeptidase [Firmicutes bacterium]|nr:M56 family metallopeptidase [Bacillota bacterium]
MEALFLKILNMSITASWIALAVIAARFLLKKAPKWITVLMWGLVGVRLVCPFSLESVFSLIPSAETVPGDILYTDTPVIQSGIAAINSAVNPIISETLAPAAGARVNPTQVIVFTASVIWIAGIVLMLIYTSVSCFRIHRKVRESVPLNDSIRLCDHADTPFIFGVIRPRIYLPSAMREQDIEYVIAHEKAHLKRRDHLWKPLGYLLLTVYWFNPILWIAYVLLCRDIEIACDEKVISQMGAENKKPYSEALINCSIPRRMIAACPLAFGETGVKERVKTVLNYKKPAFWVIILAVIACIVVTVCFLTNPMDFRFDESSNKIVSAYHFDWASYVPGTGEGICELTPAQLSELSSRLAKIKNTKKSDKYADQTPGYQISALLQDGTYIRISGYAVSMTDKVDIEWNGKRYMVSDGDFQEYLYRICTGGDAADAEPATFVTKWFDKLEAPSEMQWDGILEIKIPEFPDTIFRWSSEKIEAVTEKETIPLFYGMPVWNAYFCDLTGDGLPELCASLSIGSGMIDNRIIVFDYANRKSYSLKDRGTFDYTLRQSDSDGELYIDQKKYMSVELVSTGRLMLEDGCIKIVPAETNSPEQTQQQLMNKYPEYFGLDASNGLDVYVWQFAENSYSFGLLPHTEVQRYWLSAELWNLRGTNADEMRRILSAYNIDESDIHIIPWQHPLSSYLVDFQIVDGVENQEEKTQRYIESVRNMLFSGQTAPSNNDFPTKGANTYEAKILPPTEAGQNKRER